MRLFLLYCLALVSFAAGEGLVSKPNIVFILADDMGWVDVSFHGSDQIMTPNIDIMAYSGIILHEYYTNTQGTASRSELFTGKYAIRLGTQSDSIKAAEDRGIPITESLLPSRLRDLGYQTHLIGKWDVGKSRQYYTPTNRGFDTFYGFLGSAVDYYTYNLVEYWNRTSMFGLDFFKNDDPVETDEGYLTDVLTQHAVNIIQNHDSDLPLYLHVSHAAPHIGGGMINLQAPASEIAANSHIANSARRFYAAKVASLDKSVGQIVAALGEKGILDNTLIVFVSDNGAPGFGPTKNFGSNLPLRGGKYTPWEGGARSIAVMWHAAIPSYIFKGMFHVTDWLPTLVTAAGGTVNQTIDGISQWDSIIKEETSKRTEVLITLDDLNGFAAYREGDLKIVVGKLNEDKSAHYDVDLKALRADPPRYEYALNDSEVFKVFGEVLNVSVDIETAIKKRSEIALVNLEDVGNFTLCIPTEAKGCLYNISADPLETQDLWESSPNLVRHMILRLRTLWAGIKPRHKPSLDARANPSNRNYVWTPWLDNNDTINEPPTTTPPFPLQVSMGEFQYLLDLNLNTFRATLFDTVKSMGDSFAKSVHGLFFKN